MRVSSALCWSATLARAELVATLAATDGHSRSEQLATLGDVRVLFDKHLPAKYRAKFGWRQLAALLRRAAQGRETRPKWPPCCNSSYRSSTCPTVSFEGQSICEAYMANLLEQAIDSDDGGNAAKLIRDALGIESDEVANYVFPKTWPANREQRARIIGEWLKAEARFLIAPSIVPE